MRVLLGRGCGFSPFRLRIVNGEESEVGAWPWAALLGSRSSATDFAVVCGGSLITPRHVLSAAHCFPGGAQNPRITHVRLGEHDIARRDDDGRGRDRVLDLGVAAVRAHDGFSTTSLKNDISVVELDRSAALGDRINVVCLPTALRGVDLPDRFGSMTIFGWGSENSGGGTVTALRQVRGLFFFFWTKKKGKDVFPTNIASVEFSDGLL